MVPAQRVGQARQYRQGVERPDPAMGDEDVTDITIDEYRAVAETLPPEHLTTSGAPKMAPLNAALLAAGLSAITAGERDAFEGAGPVDESEPMPTGIVTIRLTASHADPLPLYVHGVGMFRIRVGEAVRLPIEAAEALAQSEGVEFTEED